jgi:cardiolipin synthase
LAADKLLINVLSVSLWIHGTLPTPLVTVWFIKDVVLLVGCYLYVKQNTQLGAFVIDPVTTPLQVQPTTISKMNTALQFGTIAIAICHPVFPIYDGTVLKTLCWVTGATTIASLGSYYGHSAFAKVVRNATKGPPPTPPS